MKPARLTRSLSLATLLWLASAAAVHGDELRIAVAANFSATMDALIETFEKGSEHRVLASSGSTGSHYAQIRNGAPFELFFAADVRRPRLLEEEGVAVPGSRFTYAVGRLALWSLDPGLVDTDGRVLEAGAFRHLAIANPELAPYGAAARDVLQRRGLWETLQRRIVRGQDVGQTYAFVYSGNAELGFIAYSQIRRPGRPIDGSYWLVPEAIHAPIQQQAVMLLDTLAAREFLDFIEGDAAREIIRSYGYGP